MQNPLVQVLTFVLIPAVATLVGGALAAWRTPGPRLRSAIQHFAAGVVFAAVAGELMPAVMHEGRPVAVIVGFALGVGLMLGVKWLMEPGTDASSGSASPSRSLLIAVGVDFFVDGILVGVSFVAGEEAGMLVTFALTLEVLFLALATSAALTSSGTSQRRAFGTVVALALLLVAGAALGGAALAHLSGALLEGVLSFGVAALLYLVTEELLTEAHEVPETPLTTATFFLGFLLLLLVEMAV